MAPEFTSAAIVLLGRFMPDAFFPDALTSEKIITKKEADRVKFEAVLRGQVLQFQLPWAKILVAQDRFQVETSEAPYVRICDFATKALSDLPTKYYVRAFGINLESHFNLGSIASRDALGQKLAPPKAWGQWGDAILQNMYGDVQQNPLHGGMMSIQMRQPFADERVAGWMDVWAGPSGRISNNTGILFRTNHHHQHAAPKEGGDVPTDEQKSDQLSLLNVLTERFDDSIAYSEAIFQGTLGA